MKTRTLLTVLVLSVFVAAASAQTPENAGNTGEKAGKASIPDYSYNEKYKFVDNMHRALNVVNYELKSLEKASDKLKDEATADTKQKLQSLEVEASGLSKRIDIARNATESSWNEVKSGITKDYSSLKNTMENIRTDIYNRAETGRITNENK